MPPCHETLRETDTMTELTDELYEQIKEQVVDRYREEQIERYRESDEKRHEKNRKAVHELKNAIIDNVGPFYSAFEVEDAELKVTSTIIRHFAEKRQLSLDLISAALYAWSAEIEDDIIVEPGCVGAMPLRIYAALRQVENALEDLDLELAGGGVIDSREALLGLATHIKAWVNKDD